MEQKTIQHTRPGLVGEPVTVPVGRTLMTDHGNGRCRCEWFDNYGKKTEEYWIIVRSLKR